MAMNRAQFAKMLEPGLNTLFGLEYDRYPPEYEAVFSANTSTRAFEEDVLLQGFGNAPKITCFGLLNPAIFSLQ